MTKQEILDKQWDWFIVRDEPFGMSTVGTCKYRGRGGSRCAAGLIIPDDKYHRGMEAMSLSDIFTELEWDPELYAFIRETQEAHDSASRGSGDKTVLAAGLRRIAEEHELVVPG